LQKQQKNEAPAQVKRARGASGKPGATPNASKKKKMTVLRLQLMFPWLDTTTISSIVEEAITLLKSSK
jgi:hypothetical protein